MSNNIQFFLKSTKESSYLKELINDIKRNNSYYFNNVDDLNYSFLSDYINFHTVSEVSQYSESKLTLSYYDISYGYARKKIYEYGYLVSNKSVGFSLDTESNLYDSSKGNTKKFEELLEDYIDKFGEEESNFPTIGSNITINTTTCNDEDVLLWLEDKKENAFKVKDIDLYTDGLWIEGCDYRLDILDCIVI